MIWEERRSQLSDHDAHSDSGVRSRSSREVERSVDSVHE
jgi:hypothetical protein